MLEVLYKLIKVKQHGEGEQEVQHGQGKHRVAGLIPWLKGSPLETQLLTAAGKLALNGRMFGCVNEDW